MKRRMFLTMLIPVAATACVGMAAGVRAPSSMEGVEPKQSEAGVRRSTDLGGGENLRSFMKRARDRREAAKARRDRRRRAAKARRDRARRRRRSRGD